MNRDQKKKLSRDKRRLQREKHARLQKDINDILESEIDMDIEEDELVEETVPVVEEVVAEQPVVEESETKEVIETLIEEVAVMPEEKEVTEDLDALVLEATLARDKRNMSFTEAIRDLVTKAVLTAATENKLSDEQFALVRDEGGKKVRKYPIHDKAHVRNALARAAQMMGQGGQTAKDAKAAMPKIRAAAKKMGIDMSMEKEANAIQIEKDAKGDWRAVMWVSNNFIDRDGDIICEDAHKEYVEWVNKEENKACMPAFVTWHTPGTARVNPCDYVDYFNGFLVASAKLTEKETVGLLKANKETNIGMSHGSFVLSRDPKDHRIITKYRMYEVSDLPLDKAANPFTAIETVSKEVDMDKKEYLVTLLGEEKAEAFLAKTGLKQKELKEADIENKEANVENSAPTEPVVTVKVDATDAIKAVHEAKQETTDDVIAKVLKELDIDGLNAFVTKAQTAMEKVETLEALVKELSTNQDTKLAEMITPPVARQLAWSRPSADKENILKEGQEDKDLANSVPAVPEGYWLSEITGTTPIKEKA